MPVGRSSISTPVERKVCKRLLQKVGAGPVQQDVAAGDGGSHGVGSGLDAVGKHGMLGAVQGLAPLDPQRRAADPLDPRAHPDETGGEIGDLGLARGALDQALAAGEHRRHQRVMGRADRDLGERHLVAGQAPRRPRNDIAAFELDLGAERLRAW